MMRLGFSSECHSSGKLMAFLPAFTHSPNKSLHQVTRTVTANSKPDPTEHRPSVHLATLRIMHLEF